MRRIDRPARSAKVDLVNYEPEDAYMFDMMSPLVTCNRERKRERRISRGFRVRQQLHRNNARKREREKERARAREVASARDANRQDDAILLLLKLVSVSI